MRNRSCQSSLFQSKTMHQSCRNTAIFAVSFDNSQLQNISVHIRCNLSFLDIHPLKDLFINNLVLDQINDTTFGTFALRMDDKLLR